MLKHRLITGPLLIGLFLAVIVADHWLDRVELSGFWRRAFNDKDRPPQGLVLFAFASFVVAPLAARELSAIFRAQGIETRRTLTTVAAMLGVALSYCVPMSTDPLRAIAIVSTGMILVFVGALLTFSQNRNVEGVVAAAGAVVFAMVYLGLMMGFYLALRRDHSGWWIVGIIFTTKSCDSGAYFTGKVVGRHKLAAWLSPGKTWEGLVGGVLIGTAVGLLMALLSQRLLTERDHLPLALGMLWGMIFALVGQFGDLMKSLLKRGAGIKDSSTLLPGLGGVLDVVDSPLMVAPVAYWLVAYMTPA